MNGVIVCGYGLGALVFNHVQTSYLNPNNLSPDADGYFYDVTILERVPSLFVLLFALYLTIQLIGCCLIFTPPRRPAEYIYGEGQLLLRQAGEDDDDEAEVDVSSIEANVVSEHSANDHPGTVQIRTTSAKQTDLTYREALYTREFLLVSSFIAHCSQLLLGAQLSRRYFAPRRSFPPSLESVR